MIRGQNSLSMFKYSIMKNIFSNIFIFLLAVIMVALQSCAPAREMAYITDAERDSAQQIIATYANSIHQGDQLYIYVYSQIPESVIPFNQETHKIAVEMNHINMVNGQNDENVMTETYSRQRTMNVQGYLVGNDGMITFPVLGKLHVEGITYDSLQNLIQQRLIAGDYLYDPVVTVSPMNFRVSVIGEVRRPQELHVVGDRLTILEALAMCGDVTDSGARENVTVVRERNGNVTPIMVDLTKKTLFDSECYYLQHNDIVYVEPDKHKKRTASVDENWPKYVSFGVALTAAIINISRANMTRWSRF